MIVGYGSVPLTNGSGSRRPKHTRILLIRSLNTVCIGCKILGLNCCLFSSSLALKDVTTRLWFVYLALASGTHGVESRNDICGTVNQIFATGHSTLLHQSHHVRNWILSPKTLLFTKTLWAVLWNRNYFLRFRFRLLKSYGSGSDFWKSYGSGSGSYFRKVTVPVPAPYLDHKKQICQKKIWNFFAFLHSKLF